MAKIESVYMSFDKIMGDFITLYGLTGWVIKENDYMRDKLMIAFKFTYRYLKIYDFVWYEMTDLNKLTVIDDCIKHLREIEFQFKFYFNEVWC